MCGIAGTIQDFGAAQMTRRLLSMMSHRGPDGDGFVDFTNGSLGMCRLRIRGGPSVSLPIWNGRTSSWVSYNGEIYGRVGSGKLPPEDPPAEVDSIFLEGANVDGMFACASLTLMGDSQLLVRLARDSFGIKPLYYRKTSDGYAFGSEIAPLADISSEDLELEPRAVAEFLAFGRVLGNRTFYRQIQSVPPGATVQLDEHATTTIGAVMSTEYVPMAESDLSPAVRASIEKCLISERPVGLALSGGLDSSIIAFELNSLGVEDITTVSVCIPGVADGLSNLRDLDLPAGGPWTTWQHEVATFQPDDLLPLIDVAVKSGQPTRMTSFPLYLALAEAARKAGIVVLLTGEGADEMFAGYPSYLSWNSKLTELSAVKRLYEFAFPKNRRAWLKRLLGAESVDWCQALFEQTYAALDEFDPFEGLRRAEESMSLEPLLLRTDYSLMLHGIEGRTPFLHGDVPSLARRLGSGELLTESQTKFALRKAYWNDLPPKVRAIPKHAFRAPVREWFAGPLTKEVSKRLGNGANGLADFGFDVTGIELLLAESGNGDEEAAALCFALLALEAWRRKNKGTDT